MHCMLVNMEMTIVEEKENPFFNRMDIKIRLRHEGMATPSKAEVVKELAKKYGVDESQVMVDYIFSVSGIGESFARVKILKEKPKGEKVETSTSKAA